MTMTERTRVTGAAADWMVTERLRTTCIATLAEEAASGGDILAKTVLRQAVGDTPTQPGQETLAVGCRKEGCGGCIRLLLENAGIERENCAFPPPGRENTNFVV